MSVFGKNRQCKGTCMTCSHHCVLHFKHGGDCYCESVECGLKSVKVIPKMDETPKKTLCFGDCIPCNGICSEEVDHLGPCFCGNVNHCWDASDFPQHLYEPLKKTVMINQQNEEFFTEINCVVCLQKFSKRKKLVAVCRENFCSIECVRKRWTKTHVTRTCENCQKEYERPQSVNQTRFCSWDCYKNSPVTNTAKIGEFPSTKMSETFHFDSLLELNRMKELESDRSVVAFSRSEERVPWVDADGKNRTYFPDFDITYENGDKIVEELKGYCDEKSQLKIDAAKVFFASRNQIYRVIHQRDYTEVPRAYEAYQNDFGRFVRPVFESVFMEMSTIFRQRSTCLRRQVGAIFVDSEYTKVICFGYNGGVISDNNQCESLAPGACGCIHAEINAMTKARESLEGSTLFVTLAPCKACAKLLINRKIARVFYHETYRDDSGVKLLRRHGMEVHHWSEFVKEVDREYFIKS